MRLAVDANVLLSVAMGGAAARLKTRPDFGRFPRIHTFDERLEYLPILAARKGARLEWALQPVQIRIVPADELLRAGMKRSDPWRSRTRENLLYSPQRCTWG